MTDKTKRCKAAALTALLAVTVNGGYCRAQTTPSDTGFDLAGVTFSDLADRLPLTPATAGIVPAGGPDTPPLKEWTVMVYMCAKDDKNNLEDYGLGNINDMERTGSSDKVNIVVEFSRLKTGAKRYYVTQDADRYTVSSKVLEQIPDVNLGDWRHLIEFVSWSKKNFPARKYMLVLWGHSNGWAKGNPVTLEYVNKGIAYDDVTDNNIDTPQLGKILEITGGVDIFATDACLMQMAEVGYEIKDGVKYIVGSEGTTSSRGYPYYAIFSRLAALPAMQAKEFAAVMVDAYRDKYGSGSTLSAIDAKEFPRLKLLTDEFAGSLMASGDKSRVKAAVSKTVSFSKDERKDLYHFAYLAGEGIPDPAVKASARNLMNFIRGSLVINSTGNVSPGSRENGLSIYLPAIKDSWLNWLIAPKGYNKNYNELQWAADGKWDEFIKWSLE